MKEQMDKASLIYFAQLAYFFTFVSFLTRNINWLRMLAILGGILTIAYAGFADRDPMWSPIFWHFSFLMANGANLLLSYWRQRSVSLDSQETFLSKTVLANFPSSEVKSFSAIASETLVPAGKGFIREGTDIEYLFCILQGTADVYCAGKKIAQLTPGMFIGEMSLLTQSKTRADVMANTDLTMLVWPHAKLEKWVDTDSSRLALLQTALGRQIVEELLRQSSKTNQEIIQVSA